MQSSSLFKFLFHIYSFAYELEHSFVYDIFKDYELEYSSYENCSSSFFIVHVFYITRGGDRNDGVTVHRGFWVCPCPSSSIRRVGVLGGCGLFLSMQAWCPGAWEPANMTVCPG